MPKKIDITGQRFNRLSVIREDGRSRSGQILWRCLCDCGNELRVRAPDLKNGQQSSCGCRKREVTILRNKETAKRDGLTHTPTGNSWCGMMTRCYNKSRHESNRAYWSNGVKACEFLRATPLNLILLIGERPVGLTLDRINTTGNYSCGVCAECTEKKWPMNVRWATTTQQGRNQRRNRLITINSRTQCVADWCDEYGLTQSGFHSGLKRGWTGERLLATMRPIHFH